MSFVSFTFAAFFVAVFACRIVLDRFGTSREPWTVLLIAASLVFYAWNVPAHLLLPLVLAATGYWAGRVIGDLPPRSPSARAAVAFTVSLALVLLGFWKYFDYLALGVSQLDTALGPAIAPQPAVVLGLALPLGISFYTFETISYVVDVYRGRIRPTRRFRHFLLFVTFFPHLVAGPIVRAEEFLYQIDRRRRPSLRVLSEGVYLTIRGFFLKVVVADNLATIVDANWPAATRPGANPTLGILVTVLFAFQILCDFDGYSTIARGTAYLLGFRLPVNFDSPYVATSFREFWQRWHITLSRWLRDYLYVPLGGNRVSRPRLYVNLLVVMTLGGLWHGAANTFLVWGALHGTALAVERALGLHRLSERGGLVGRVAWWSVVQATVLVAWVFFRAADVESATTLLGNVATGSWAALPESIPLGWIALLLAVPVGEHVRSLAVGPSTFSSSWPSLRAAWAATMLYAVCTAYGPAKTFIYFRF